MPTSPIPSNTAFLHKNMSEIIRFSPSLRLLSSRPITTTNRHDSSRELSISSSNYHNQLIRRLTLPGWLLGFKLHGKSHELAGKFRVFSALSQEGSLQEVGGDLPVSFKLEPICTESQFDRVIAEAQQLEEPVIIVWMASWCRKCIYLKPKLEKLAADYYQRVRFFCVDVNNVPHKLVARAGVTKMPTIQLWKDGEKQGEVVGGHKAYMVINEVRDMIENESTT